MKNSSARYRLKFVDRGPFGCESVNKCLPCIYKRKVAHWKENKYSIKI